MRRARWGCATIRPSRWKIAAANCASAKCCATRAFRCPDFFPFGLDKRVEKILPRVQFPCVVKPLRLAASQGVIRANNAEEFQAAVARIKQLAGIARSAGHARTGTRSPARRTLHSRRGSRRRRIARRAASCGFSRVFDKPDPLEGPVFRGDDLRHAVAAAGRDVRPPFGLRRTHGSRAGPHARPGARGISHRTTTTVRGCSKWRRGPSAGCARARCASARSASCSKNCSCATRWACRERISIAKTTRPA